MRKTREPRNPDLKTKPNAYEWFEKYPKAHSYFNKAKDIVMEYCRGTYHGFIDRNGTPEYRFNRHDEGYTKIVASIKHSTVRLAILHEEVMKEFQKDHCKSVADQNGHLYEVVDFRVNDENSVKKLRDFLDLHHQKLKNFAHPSTENSIETPQLVEIDEEFDIDLKKSIVGSREKRLERLSRATRIPKKVTVKTEVYLRNADVVAEALYQAEGKCWFCKKDAPFKRNDKNKTPYLEVHHLLPLKYGGEDTVENARAACPNCHRKQHFGV